MKIEKILQNKLGYILTIQNNDYFLIEDFMVYGNLYKNTEIDEKTFQNIQQWNLVSLAFLKIKSFINFKPRSLSDIKNKLKTLNFEEEIINETLKYLQQFKIIDDALYSKYYVNYFILNIKKGRKTLENKLKEKQINPEIIENILSTYSYEDERRNALYLLKKTFEPIKNKNAHFINNKLKMTLLQNGFDLDFMQQFKYETTTQRNNTKELEKLYDKLLEKNKIFLFKSQAYSKGFKNEEIENYMFRRKNNETNI